ncbi:MAG: amidohydrolase [Micavibrio aeruginosavorus]|uniref:Amidohydrolase n=1 Tax=Micavibrio aeruginosavorus TaxID=349221 RepID=A0A2W5MR08_9BACT|nr:MAG: amidohydrolase [Micavibrio aeruginosavorus]
MTIKAAVIQLNAGPVIEDNLRAAEALIRAAAKDGATLIATPENTCRMRAKIEDKIAASYEEKEHPAIPFFSNLAKELKITLMVGSISSIRVGEGVLANRCFVFAPDGGIAAKYDKIHMFDVDLPNGDQYRESATNRPGSEAVLADVAGLKIGLSVCYDLRFPHLYRALAKEGAQILSIPAAFTVPTGQAHWEVLLRARAIENGAFVIAPAQVGAHEGGRATYGHSMIIAPWGEIIAQIQGDSVGYVCAQLDLSLVDKARTAVPALKHDRAIG